jgi:hypothetical protein
VDRAGAPRQALVGAFGRAFDRVFIGIGALMVAGAVVGLVGGGNAAVLLITGLASAVVLLGAGARTVVGAVGA